jgi:5-formyltetrahydrofolate cyclo-ligase
MSPTQSAKVQMRSTMRAWRRSLDDADLTRRSARLVANVAPLLAPRGLIIGYDAIRGEPDLASLWENYTAAGATVRRVTSADDPCTLPLDDVAAVVMPALAVTPTGQRLGQGGGWFDRLLARCDATVTTIAVCFDEQVVDALAVDDHDRLVDLVVTDQRALVASAGGTGRQPT